MHYDILLLLVPYLHIEDVVQLLPNIDEYTWKILVMRDYPSMHIDDTLTYRENYKKMHAFFNVLLTYHPYVYADAANVIYQVCTNVDVLKKFCIYIQRYLNRFNDDPNNDIINLHLVYHLLIYVRDVYISHQIYAVGLPCVMYVRECFTFDDAFMLGGRMANIDINNRLSMHSLEERLQFITDVNAMSSEEEYRRVIEADIKVPALCFYMKHNRTMHKFIACNVYNSMKHEKLVWPDDKSTVKLIRDAKHYFKFRIVSRYAIKVLISKAIDSMN